jgi:uncharacterized protein YyaL (SSP411 family)
MAGSGSWPNNVFMTTDLKAYFAGSYFPPTNTPGRGPGFPQVLATIRKAWDSERDKVLNTANRVHEHLEALQQLANEVGQAPIEPAKWLEDGARTALKSYDPVNGGFAPNRSRSRFPRAPTLSLLLSAYETQASGTVLSALTGTLDALAQGGIYDHVGGGFHRYSTDPEWSVPHFEKMLYDNAQLLSVYAKAYELTERPCTDMCHRSHTIYVHGLR